MNIQKKNMSVLLALVMCLIFLFTFSQAVLAANSVRLSAGSEAGVTGDIVTVTISIEEAAGTEGGQFEFSFDSDIAVPVDISAGNYVSDASNEQFNYNLDFDEDTLMVIWVTPQGDTSDADVVCTIDFELVAEGETSLTFGGVVFAPADIDVSAIHSTGSISVDDEKEAKQKAINAANEAIAALKDPEDITLTDKPDIEAARALVDTAKSDHDADEDDFEDLSKLIDAEEMIAKLEAVKAADDAIADLPSIDRLALDDKPVVVAARALVNKAKDDHNAVNDDFLYLSALRAAENRIKELEGRIPTPPTGAVNYLTYAGMLFVALGIMAYLKRKSLLSFK